MFLTKGDKISSSPSVSMDDSRLLLHLSTETLIAHEKFMLKLKKTKNSIVSKTVMDDAILISDHIREMRSKLDGSCSNFVCTGMNVDTLHPLKQTLSTLVPDALTAEVKSRICDLVRDSFEAGCERILFIGLMVCPWYLASTSPADRGLQAKHNCLTVVYVGGAEKFMAPVNQQLKEKSYVIDYGWFYAVEVSHFARCLVKSKVRIVEALYLPDNAVIFAAPEWTRLQNDITQNEIICSSSFVEQCLGQAIGVVSRKSKAQGEMRAKDGATAYEFCESFRLAMHADTAVSAGCLCTDKVRECCAANDLYGEAFNLLRDSFKEDCDFKRTNLLELLLKVKRRVDEKRGSKKERSLCATSNAKDAFQKIENWLLVVRIGTREFSPTTELEPECRGKLISLLHGIGPAAADIRPESVIAVARAGSHLYDLSMADSDADYVIIYADPIEKILSNCKLPVESLENRGKKLSVEFGAYEVRLFCEMLLKGSIVMVELIFSEKLDYMSDLWMELASKRSAFVTEHIIRQYFGLIKNNMATLGSAKHSGTSRERKLLYQIFHKLDSLNCILQSKTPSVKCCGEVKDFILSIRNTPIEETDSIRQLYCQAEAEVDRLTAAFANRLSRLPENVSYQLIVDWLLEVRGWTVDK